MTKFVLVGGYPTKAKDGGKSFFESIVDGANEPVRILVCEFARKGEDFDELFEADKNLLNKMLPNEQLDIRLATYAKLTGEIAWANTIYLKGGDSLHLLSELRELPNFSNLLEGKILAGTSAGANVMGQYFYGLKNGRLREGLGLLPIKVLVHYRSDYNGADFDWDKAFEVLDEYKEKLPVVALPEGQFKIFQN